MAEQQVIIKIEPDGSIQVQAAGFTGPSCVDAVRRYAQALGIELDAENLPEFYQVEADSSSLAIGGEGSW